MQQAIGDVGPADLGEHEHQVFGADEAGGEMPAALLDVLDEVLGGQLRLLALDEIEGQGQHVAGLGVAFDAAVGGDVGAVERVADASEQLLVGLGFVSLAEHLGGAPGQPRAVGEVGRVDDVLRRVGLDAEPVAEAMDTSRAGAGRACCAGGRTR